VEDAVSRSEEASGTPAGQIAKAIKPLSAESTKAEQKGNWMHSIQRLSAQAGKTQFREAKTDCVCNLAGVLQSVSRSE